MEKLELINENLLMALTIMDNDELEKSLRDSLIQRFEFCAELFWKTLRRYEEEKLGLLVEANAPRPVIMAACKARVISEDDTERFLELIKSRNFTSHIYKEEVADRMSVLIPGFYLVMKKYADTLK